MTINDKDEVFFGRKFLGRINYSLPDRESKKSGGLFTQSARREGDDFRNDAEAFKAIKLEMDRRKYWPNIYRENDHGNISQLDARGNEINAWV